MNIFNDIYTDLLLEKDNRQKMMKFGIPEDVANYLHSINDKYSIWFANQIKNMEGYQNARSKVNWIQVNLETPIQGIIDWVSNIPNVSLNNYNWEQAVEAQVDYHANIKTKTLEGEEQNTILKKYKDGFYWVDLETNRCTEEGDLMGHCANTEADTMYSLRRFTPETGIEAFITIGASPDEGEWRQAKGKKNSHPKEVYYPYIADILVSNGMLRFRSEYQASDDFDGNDLKQYVTNNPNSFKNSDELIDKIEDINVSFEDFEKIYKEKQMDNLKYFHIDLTDDSYDEGEYMRHTVGIYFSMDINKFGEFVGNVDRFLTTDNPHEGEDSQKSKNIMDVLTDYHFNFNYVNVHVNKDKLYTSQDDTITFRSDIADEDDISTLSDEGLESFSKFCDYYRGLDEGIEEDELFNKLLEYFIDNDVIPNPDTPESIHSIKPIYREDPRQQKFPFAENVFYQLFNEVLNR